ncbi:MAG: sulfotransferase domain-containing protein [Cyanobium sp.]
MLARRDLSRRWDAVRNSDLLELMVLTVPPLLGAERCGLFVLDPEAGEIWLEAGSDVVQRQICVAPEGSMVGDCIRQGAPLSRHGLEEREGAHQQVGESLDYRVHSALTVPVRSDDGVVVGALQVLNRSDREPFDADDQARLEAVAFTLRHTVTQLHASRELLRRSRRLDAEIALLLERAAALRPGHSYRTFEPAQPLGPEGFLHHRWQGKVYPPFIDRRATEHLQRTWDTQANDVLIATHQKVGTHLAKKYLVELVRHSGDLPERNPMAGGDIGHAAVPWPEVYLSQESEAAWQGFLAATSDRPRLWYIHCAQEDLPCRSIHPETRFVAVVRDPRAVVVSQYFFWMHHPLLGLDPALDLDHFSELFCTGDLYFGDYFRHVLSWLLPHGSVQPRQICALRYEDMVERKQQTTERLQAFLFPGEAIAPEQRDAIAASTGFETMKREISANPGSFHLNPAVYFRSGTTNDWSQHLSAAAEARIAATCRERWAGLEEHPLLGGYLAAMAPG